MENLSTENALTILVNGLVPIYHDKEQEPLVNARDLHAGLEISRQFADWIKDQISGLYLAENLDFTILSPELGKIGRPSETYILTLDTAKHIALASRTEKGRLIRKDFIEAQKKLRQIASAPAQPTLQIEDKQKLEKLEGIIKDLGLEKEINEVPETGREFSFFEAAKILQITIFNLYNYCYFDQLIYKKGDRHFAYSQYCSDELDYFRHRMKKPKGRSIRPYLMITPDGLDFIASVLYKYGKITREQMNNAKRLVLIEDSADGAKRI